ncbi:hypothetical protein MPLB_1750014 [Mesorhizobium sp. ORS 3324]|nr:hypothetical protein MPLB_1750014 [Mesorhizobium sp. ORS 3324]
MPSRIAARNATVITEGLAFGESPRWHEGRLWLCNWGTGEIVAVDEEGKRGHAHCADSPALFDRLAA